MVTEAQLANYIKHFSRNAFVLGKEVKVLNLPYMLAPDALHMMVLDKAIAFCYYDTPEGIEFYYLERDDSTIDMSKFSGIRDKYVVKSFVMTVKQYVDATKRGDILLYPESPDSQFSNGRT